MSSTNTPESYIDAQEKLMTLNLLQIAFKKFDTLESFRSYLLTHDVEVSVANLSRYINGKAIPKSKLKDSLLEVLVDNKELGLTIKDLILSHIDININEQGTISVNNSYLLNDSKNLNAILFLAIQQNIIPCGITKIITAEVDGIPIATTLAHLLNIDCVYARKKKPIGTMNYHSEDILSPNTGRIETLYFPEKFIRSKEQVLIIDDIIRSGATQTALVNLVSKCEGIPLKVLILVGIGEHWKKTTKLRFTEFQALVPLS